MPPKQQQNRISSDFKQLGTIHNRALVDTNSFNDEELSIDFIMVSDNNAGLRYDWWDDEIFEEELDPKGATFEGLNTFFKDHDYCVDTAMGQVLNPRFEDGKAKSKVKFNRDDEDSVKLYKKYRNGILTDVSIGYDILETIVTKRDNAYPHVLVTRYNIYELSAVWKGFDKNATIGRSATDINSIKEVEDEKIEADLLKKKRKLKLDLAEML